MVISNFFWWQNFAILAKRKNPNNHRQGRKCWKIVKKNCHILRKKSYEIGKIFEGFGQARFFLAFFAVEIVIFN
jgi:hypothetical protein